MKNGPYELVIAPVDYPGKKYRGRYVYEHHLVWWQNTGQLVGDGFDIHHKNENKRDNRFENLERKSHIAHCQAHADEKRVPLVEVPCAQCSGKARIAGHNYRWRLKNGQKKFFCSRSCQVKRQWIDRKSKMDL